MAILSCGIWTDSKGFMINEISGAILGAFIPVPDRVKVGMEITELAEMSKRAAAIELRCKDLEQNQKIMALRLAKANTDLEKTKQRLSRAYKKTKGIVNKDDEELLFKLGAKFSFVSHINGSRALKVISPVFRKTYSYSKGEKRGVLEEAIEELRKHGWK